MAFYGNTDVPTPGAHPADPRRLKPAAVAQFLLTLLLAALIQRAKFIAIVE